jgi:photosystem II stability/assembly factor-like uncharacterized protein
MQVIGESAPSKTTLGDQALRTKPWFDLKKLTVLAGGFVLACIMAVLALLQPPRPDAYSSSAALTSADSIWDYWLRPIETNRMLRLPRGGGEYGAISMLSDGRRGWMVDKADGGILATSDGGNTWTFQGERETGPLSAIVVLEDGRHGWAVGEQGSIVATSDGGVTWSRQQSGTDVLLTSISMMKDGLHGWVVGDKGTILATSDGGLTWFSDSFNTDSRLNSISMQDNGRGWIVGDNGTILVSYDGRSWGRQTANNLEGQNDPKAQAGDNGKSTDARAPALRCVRVFDQKRALIVGGNGTILTTADGGSTWAKRSSGTKAELLSISIGDGGERAWVVGENGTVLLTDDSGGTWTSTPSGTTSRLDAVIMLGNGQQGWAVGDNGLVMSSSDSGRSWVRLTSGLKAVFNSVAMSPDWKRGWILGDDGLLLLTADGGATWEPQETGTAVSLMSAQMRGDGQHGWVVGEHGTILVTDDGGQKWSSQASPTSTWLNSISMRGDGLHGVISGDDGLILTTSDGGKTWGKAISNTTASLNSVGMSVDGQLGWAVGYSGMVLGTSDGGKTWVLSTTAGEQSSLRSISVSPKGLPAWIVGDSGAINSTGDGKTWLKVASNTSSQLESINMLPDGTHGWIVGDDSTVLFTKDAGATWEPRPIGSPGAWLSSISMTSDGSKGVIVGDQGTLLSTEDGGKTWTQAQYSKHPARWLYLSLAIIGVMALVTMLVWGEEKIDDVFGVAAALSADEPVTRIAEDELAFSPIVETLSRFLRNTGTQPSLTIAIDGEWGAGKSSLMRMLQTEMKGLGFDTVWFNPWHHQKESVMLAALLQHIRAEGVPSILRFRGWRYRGRLWTKRLKRRPYMCACLVGGVALSATYLIVRRVYNDYESLRKAVAPAMELLDALVPPKADSTNHVLSSLLDVRIVMVAILVTAGIFLVNGLKSFPLLPGVLLATFNNKFSVNSAQIQTDYRRRFAETFSDVTLALKPRHLVVFIDDLDRCTPDKALECLEATNYLASSGKCFIVLGMARGFVERLIGLANKDLAAEIAVSEGEYGGKEQSDLARRLRRNYARRYLEKLVQLNIRVPSAESRKLIGMLVNGAPARHQLSRRWGSVLMVWRSWRAPLGLIAIVAVAIAVGQSSMLPDHLLSPPVTSAPVPLAPAAVLALPPEAASRGTAPSQGSKRQPSEQTSGAPTAIMGAKGDVMAPASGYSFTGLMPIAISISLVLLTFSAFFRRDDILIRDTSVFSEALREWTPVAASRQQSPRSVKLFGNLSRYTAMMLLDEEKRRAAARFTTNARRILGKVNWLKRGASEPSSDGSKSDHNAKKDRYGVALAAIYHVRPDLIEDEEKSILVSDWTRRLNRAVQADLSEEQKRREEVRAILRSESGGSQSAQASKEAPPMIPDEDVDRRISQDSDLKEDFRRLRRRRQAVAVIRRKVGQLAREGIAWPPPPDIVERFRLFVVGTVQFEGQKKTAKPMSRARALSDFGDDGVLRSGEYAEDRADRVAI